MDAHTVESRLTSRAESWLQRERASCRCYDLVALAIALFLRGIMGLSAWLLRRGAEPGSLLSAPVLALLLVANLIPAIVLMALYSRKVAIRRAEQGGLGSGRLHVRLVALFSAIAAVPTVLVAIFASLLFQSGIEFWFSDRARNMLENTVQVASASYNQEVERVANETVTMRSDVSGYLRQIGIEDPAFGKPFSRQVHSSSVSAAV